MKTRPSERRKGMDEVEKKLNQVHDDLLAIKTWMGSEFGYNNSDMGNVYRHITDIKTDIKDMKEDLQHFINGNGKPGIKQDISTLQSRVNIIVKVMWGVVFTTMTVIGKIAYDSWNWFINKG